MSSCVQNVYDFLTCEKCKLAKLLFHVFFTRGERLAIDHSGEFYYFILLMDSWTAAKFHGAKKRHLSWLEMTNDVPPRMGPCFCPKIYSKCFVPRPYSRHDISCVGLQCRCHGRARWWLIRSSTHGVDVLPAGLIAQTGWSVGPGW